ncbi:MAG: hypothetical protein J7J52_04065 [Deltaproteobacteria bacterium]|nr:hypothetical protein [Deltaproteobacteria bacterium]
MRSQHEFHIPVMGIGFTIDTPVRIAPFGISSVISLVDDELMEKLRAFYCDRYGLPYEPITSKDDDCRARRITNWLNLVKDLAEKRFREVCSSPLQSGSDLVRYLDMLPDSAPLRIKYEEFLKTESSSAKAALEKEIREGIVMGAIDVNIMTKIDRVNYRGNKKLPLQYNDALAALRGFAKSRLNSSLVLSAGINRFLYSYIPEFDDFFVDKRGRFKKRIILKVSDYKSAIIQGKFLAKKGIWVSEYRIESGLNCGGHAFATDGFLMGPILDVFTNGRNKLYDTVYSILIKALKSMGRDIPDVEIPMWITAQGGIGTNQEHNMLINYYKVDGTGWATPFLLVPEVTNVDDVTRELLQKAKEDDLYLSDISPLDVLFNSLKGNTKDVERQMWLQAGTPGSPCPKKYLVSNTEFTKRPICTASRQYQTKKIEEIKKQDIPEEIKKKACEKVCEKTCICVGLGTAALLVNGLDTTKEGTGVTICPGPNLAWFSRVVSLEDMVDHIYGRKSILTNPETRPHMFIKELAMYVRYVKEMLQETLQPMLDKQKKHFETFHANLKDGIEYYRRTVANLVDDSENARQRFLSDLADLEERLSEIFSHACPSS